jgi:hypothetical protein
MGGAIATILRSPFVRELAVFLLTKGLDRATRGLRKKQGKVKRKEQKRRARKAWRQGW